MISEEKQIARIHASFGFMRFEVQGGFQVSFSM